MQIRATKLVKGFSRLQKLGFYLLYSKHEQGGLIETYKVFKGYYNIEWSQLLMLNSEDIL